MAPGERSSASATEEMTSCQTERQAPSSGAHEPLRPPGTVAERAVMEPPSEQGRGERGPSVTGSE